MYLLKYIYKLIMFEERKLDDNYGQFIILDENMEKNLQRNKFIKNLDYIDEHCYNDYNIDCINDSYYDDIKHCKQDDNMSIINTFITNIYCIWQIFTTLVRRR